MSEFIYGDDGYNYRLGLGSNWTRGVKILFITYVVCFILQVLLSRISYDLYSTIEEYFALNPNKVIEKFCWWQLLTATFMHDVNSPFHILFNLLVLYFFGHSIEEYYGTRKFFVFYILASIFASLVYTIFSFLQHQERIGLGASGALMGILALCGLLFPNMLVIFMIFPMRCRTMVLIVIGIDVYTAFISQFGFGASLAHLGGALFGYLFYKWQHRFSGYFDRMEQKIIQKEYLKDQRKKEEIRGEVDRLLDKINKEGMSSLTPKEKDFLKRASKEYQRD